MDNETLRKLDFLKNYPGRPLRIMEICGSHTAAISKTGLRSLISPKISLIPGPGCPVCVTPAGFIDRLIGLAKEPEITVCVFGDMLRVPGSMWTLSQAKGDGADVIMVYSPLDMIKIAAENPGKTYIFGAVGFETTTPAYALLMDEIIAEGIENIRLLTALKTMPEAVARLCSDSDACTKIDAFLAPGHVCAVTGYRAYETLAKKYGVNFAVSGFEEEELVDALYTLAQYQAEESEETGGKVCNCYPRAVERDGNSKASALVDKYFTACDALWRGIGLIPGSGLRLRDEYKKYDAGSGDYEDVARNKACRCGEVLSGKVTPDKCPLFGRICMPFSPQGACMVSEEGACRAWILNGSGF